MISASFHARFKPMLLLRLSQILFDFFLLFQGKYHTAVSKFREALVLDLQQLEALFNITLQYRKLGNVTAEIQSLTLLKQVMWEHFS